VGVNVGAAPVGAFIALIAAVILIGIIVVARRRGHVRDRGALIAIGVIVALLVAFGMTGGFVPGT
jgi:threonine/homoserine efflux transporter RhtA